MSNLYYRFEGFSRNVFEEYLRRVYSYTGPWDNRDLEIVQIDESAETFVFQTFFEEQEVYPVITISTTGGSNVRMGFNDQVQNVYDYDIPLGVRSLQLVPFSTDSPVAVQLPTNFTGSISGFTCDMIHTPGYPVDDITVNLWQNYFSTTGSILLASGSIRNFDFPGMKTFFAQVWPYTVLQPGNDYWVEFMPQSGSIYRLAVDPSCNGFYSSIAYSGGVPTGNLVSGSLYGGMRLSPVFRLGGAHEFNLQIKCSMKNSIEKAQNLADLAELYIKLGQHGNIDRGLLTNAKFNFSRFQENGVAFFTSQGISIKNVTKGGIENRRRGDNDIIFSVGVTVELRTEWNIDVDEDHILDIDQIFSDY